MPILMEYRKAHLTGAPVAECPACHTVCVYWDDDDTDDDGNLWCYCGAWDTPLPPHNTPVG